jgi:hypothetical protein
MLAGSQTAILRQDAFQSGPAFIAPPAKRSPAGRGGRGAGLEVEVSRQDSVSEWLRRWTRNPFGSARRGSNLLAVVLVPPAVLRGAKMFCRQSICWEGCMRVCHLAAWSSGIILVIVRIVIDLAKVINIIIMLATVMVIDRNYWMLG